MLCEFSVTLGALLLLLVEFRSLLGGVESSGRRLECLWVLVGSYGGLCGGLVAVLWAGGEECGRWEAVRVLFACCLLPAACCLLRIYDFY